MSTNEYFLVFESILYAAVTTQMIHGFAGLYRDRGTYKLSRTHIAFNILVLLNMVQRYYALQDFKHYKNLTSSMDFLIFVLALPGLLVFQTYLMFPAQNKGVNFHKLIIEYRYVMLTSILYGIILIVYTNLEDEGFQLVNYHLWVPQTLMSLPLVFFVLTKRLVALQIFLGIGIPLILYFMIYIR